MAWTDNYAVMSGAFGIMGPMYGPQGHRGADYRNGAGAAIHTYIDGVVTKIQYSSYIGTCVVVRSADGTYQGWAHTRNVNVSVGQAVSKGQQIAQVAGSGDRPGSTWAGPHIHTTWGPSNESIFSGTVWDPVPRIATAVSSTAGGGSTPIVPIEQEMDEDMVIRIQATNRGIALVGAGYYYGLIDNEQVANSDVLISKHLTGNDRQFDLWVQMIYGGSSSPSVSELNSASASATRDAEILAAVKADGGGSTGGVTEDQIDQIADKTASKIKVPTKFNITGEADAA